MAQTPIDSIVENLTCIAFYDTEDSYCWSARPYGIFVKYQGEDLHSVRSIRIVPFDADVREFGTDFDENYTSRDGAVEIEERFASAMAYRISVAKVHSEEIIQTIETDGFADMIDKLTPIVQALVDDGYSYRFRDWISTKSIDAKRSIEAKEEAIVKIQAIRIAKKIEVEPQAHAVSLVPLESKKEKTASLKRKRTSEHELLASKNVPRILQSFYGNRSAAFIYLNKTDATVDSIIVLNKNGSYLDVGPVHSFHNKTKHADDLFEYPKIPIHSDKFKDIVPGEPEKLCIRTLLAHGFVFIHYYDDFGTDQLIKTMRVTKVPIEFTYDE
jgi:hypothetical protein